MYHVELLPGSSSHPTPGWTYVADRGFDPAKAAITPAIGRKRGIRDPGRADISSRQNNAIVRHLAELDRENHRDIQIPVPVKQQKDAAGRGTRGKVTSNVRRILQSQKTFRNYLDDEEAALAQAAAATTTQSASQRAIANRVTKHQPSSHRSSTPATPKPESTAKQQRKKSTASALSRASTIPPPETPSESTEQQPPQSGTETESDEQKQTEQPDDQLIKSEHDDDPLLRSYIPSAPSQRIMQALLAEPPLTYNASRAGPPITTPSSNRQFCCFLVCDDVLND
ncbi:hypothetical protein FE257_009214 [Aspergillus nanangensis]|uniref:Uncharacterized protein n=1 Tax=Aspergillus nanangensis TaxID=2582783 RepID=A0AAD4CKI5_ASPNN|nr:hypothetical protein FE257_009214 [Aspergillus nanangensis]